jgi:uncharacterized protein YjbI with pentapeptide repeats
MWDRLRGKKVNFSGRFDWHVRERLTLLAREHGATIARDVAVKIDYVVVQSGSGPKTLKQRIKALNAKGSAIQVLDADDFETTVKPTDDEIVAAIRRGQKGQKLFNDGINTWRHRGSAAPEWVIVGQSFAGLDLTRFDFQWADFDCCDFSGAKLERTEFTSVTNCKFDNAAGNDTEFVRISGCSFKGAKLIGGDFSDQTSDVDFTGADLSKAEFDHDFYSKKSKLTGVIFRNAKLELITFDNVTLVQPDFQGADLSKAGFEHCTVEAGDFRKATLVETSLAGSTFKKPDFSGANLRNANLVDADLANAKFDGADLTGCNLRGAKLGGATFSKAKGYNPSSQAVTTAGPAMKELDKAIAKAKRIKFAFRLTQPIDGDDSVSADSDSLDYGWAIRAPREIPRNYRSSRKTTMSEELLLSARVLGDVKIRFETIEIKTTKSKLKANELKDVLIKALCEAFGQEEPDQQRLADQLKTERRARLKATAGARKKRAAALARAQATQQKQAKRQLAQMEQKVQKAVGGKVSDIASFLKALEVRAEKAKIDKATAMLKAEKFQLFNDITDAHMGGVVKSQTDPDLVYACRVDANGQYACCTQNLNICGGLRGSICKHLLVLIIGLVKAGELDPSTIDGWVAKTRSNKPELNKETMGEIFIRYKGAEAGEVDWRPTETVPEDYYAL